jgi:hypothetical protein
VFRPPLEATLLVSLRILQPRHCLVNSAYACVCLAYFAFDFSNWSPVACRMGARAPPAGDLVWRVLAASARTPRHKPRALGDLRLPAHRSTSTECAPAVENGSGYLMVKASMFDFPPPGVGFLTAMLAVPVDATAAAVTYTVISVGLR